MFEDVSLLLEFVFKDLPTYPNHIILALQGLQGTDTLGLFQFFWIPFNIYIFIRILQPSLHNDGEPSKVAYCIGAFFIWLGWVYFHLSSGQASTLRFVREMDFPLLAVKLFCTYVNSLLLLKASFLIIRLYQMSFKMYRVESVIHHVFKDVNLKLILSTKNVMGYLVSYMLLNALGEFISPLEDLVIGIYFMWGFATIPLLIICFFISKEALHKRHQSVFIEVVADQGYISSGQNLEETLRYVASRRMGTDLIVNDIFMGQIFRLVLAAILTYSVNHFLG